MKRCFAWMLGGLILIRLLSFSSISLAEEGKWTKKADMTTARQGELNSKEFSNENQSNDSDNSNDPVLALTEDTNRTIKEEDLDPRGSISGRVIYKESGQPAVNVPIRAVGMEPGMSKTEYYSQTAIDGTYMLKDIVVGQYIVMLGDTWEWHQLSLNISKGDCTEKRL